MTSRPHARLSPSSAYRWLYCEASVQFIEDGGFEDESGDAAKEGSILHAWCEECLREDKSAFDLIGRTSTYEGYTYTLDEETAEMMQDGLDLINMIPGKLYVERRLDLGRWMPGQFGTMDVGIIGKRIATCYDWKWGYIPVQAVDNDQARIYLLGLWDNIVRHIAPDIKRFRIIIFQPRAPGGGGEWELDIEDLLDWGIKLKFAAKRTYHKDAKFVPGKKQCEFCPGAKNLVCEAYEIFVRKMLIEDLDELDSQIEIEAPLRLNRRISPEQRSHIIKHRTMINKFLDRLQTEALDDALKGRAVPMLKAVDGRMPPRKWIDIEHAEEELGLMLTEDQLYRKKLISPTQLQKITPEKLYRRLESRLVDFGEKKPVLVPVEDSRPSTRNLRDEFDD